MKLLEITDFSKMRHLKYKGDDLIPVSGDIIGKGSFANVHQTGPNTVTKVAEIEYGEQDPIVMYLKECANHPNNPFFPNIKHAKMYEHRTSNDMIAQMLIVQMEKLQPLNTATFRKAVLAEFGNIGFELTDEEKQRIQRKNENISEDELHEKVLENLMHKVWTVFDMSTEDVSKFLAQVNNPHFEEAVWILTDLKFNEGFEFDMHTGNWMVRTSGKTPQLVITDPFEPYQEDW